MRSAFFEAREPFIDFRSQRMELVDLAPQLALDAAWFELSHLPQQFSNFLIAGRARCTPHRASRGTRRVGFGGMRPPTLVARRRLYLLARVVVARYYRRPLTLDVVARAIATSPRQLQRAYEQFGEASFSEDLLARRMRAGAELLIDQPAIPVADVARLVGYSRGSHFAAAFRRRYGLSPARFRAQALKRGG
ncbi:MAG TPA: helix-turn-helix transcriptional regulator [Solirubrobacteraceae bacterium]|nr:helix-turn-helix transcriptional regulator [Solirubrobacteraceae bacterium]